MYKLTLGVLISAWTSLTSHFISLFFCYLNFVLNFALCRSFPDSSVVKESACNTGEPGSIPRMGRSSGEGIAYPLQYSWTSLVAQLVKNLTAMRETWVRSLGWEDPLEKGTATHSQYSGLENSMEWIVHGVIKSWTRLSNFHLLYVTTVCSLG